MSEIKHEANGETPQRKRFSLKRKFVEVEVENIKGDIVTWTLRELTGSDRDAYQNTLRSKIQVTGPNTGEIKDFTNLQGDLLARSLYDETNKLVEPQQIQLMPASVQSELYDMATKLSGLDKGAKEEAKNESPASV